MSPAFAAAVDPIFTHVLKLIDQIENGQTLEPNDVNARIRGLLDQAENQITSASQWDLAKYALVAWIDDALISAEWEGRDWWEQNRLEFALFKTADAFTVFFLKAKDATELPQKDALEVYYVCVVLGFRGLYGDPEAMAHTGELGIASSLDEWARRTSMSIQLGQGRAPLLQQGRPGTGAPPLEGKYLLIGSALLTVFLAVVTFAIAYKFYVGEG